LNNIIYKFDEVRWTSKLYDYGPGNINCYNKWEITIHLLDENNHYVV